MLSESSAGTSRPLAGGRAFWWRLSDNLFRRIGWFLLPVLVLSLLGVMQASKTLELYQSSGTLSTSLNPLVPIAGIDGINASYWESPADATSRSINEQLGTNSFLNRVATSAGLGEAIESGLLDIAIVRESIWASPKGDSTLSVYAQWDDPQTAYKLTTATIATFQKYLEETAARRSNDAEQFWTERRDALITEREAALAELEAYANSLPPLDEGEDRTELQQFEMKRLSDAVTSIEAAIVAAETEIDNATLTRTQDAGEAGRTIDVVDQPRVATAPESTLIKRVSLVISFMLLGMVIAAAALLVTTVLDHSVSSTADLLAVPGISLVATVPPVRIGDQKTSRRSARRRRATAKARMV